MIGEIKEVEINGKKFELSKQGVSGCLEIQSIFMELFTEAKIPEDMDTEDPKIGMYMMRGMRGKVVEDIRGCIIRSVQSPKLTEESYENLDPAAIPELFMAIYSYNVGEAEVKKNEQSESSTSATT